MANFGVNSTLIAGAKVNTCFYGILVPELGHIRNIPVIGRVEATRGLGRFTNARQV